jgi:DNA-binding XRE family transcriptional regulator
MHPRSSDKRWDSKLALFVHKYSVKDLASDLGVDNTAVYQWVSGRTKPRLAHAFKIQRLARRRRITLTLDEIYRHFHADRPRGARRTSSLLTRKPEPVRA